MNASNRPLATYARASAAEPIERDTRIALRIARARLDDRPPDSASEIDVVLQPVLRRRVDRAAVERRRAVGGRRERLVAGRVVDDADDRPAVDDQPDRDAEQRDAVGVVHRAVERVDDPGPAAAARSAPSPAPGRACSPDLLGQDRVVREPLPDRLDDQLLGQVVDLGDDVLGALVVDPLEPLVAVHQDRAGRARRASIANASSAAQVGRARIPAVGDGVGAHGARQATASGRPSCRTRSRWSNVIVAPGRDPRAEYDRARVDPAIGRDRSGGTSPDRRSCPRCVTAIVATTARRRGGATASTCGRERPDARDREAGDDREHDDREPRPRRRPCRGPASSRRPCSPSGLQRSHSPTSSATGAPAPGAPWVGAARAGRAGVRRGGGHRRDGATVVRGGPRCHGGRPSGPAYQRPASGLDQRVDVRRRPGEDDRPVRAGLAPALPGRARLADPLGSRRGRASPSQSPWNPTRTRWSCAAPPGRLERLEVERQVPLEVVVERAPAVADPAGQPGARPASRRR